MTGSVDSLRRYLGRHGSASQWARAPGVVVVGSGKGGVGTSTVAALLAMAGAQEGRRVLLVDGDEGVGSLHLLMGFHDGGPGLGALRGGGLTPEALVRHVTGSLWLLPGGSGDVEDTLSTAPGERRALLRRVAGLYADYDLVVVDGGSHLSSVLAACLAGAERLVTVTSPDRVAMAATYALLKVSRDRFPRMPMEILVNGGDGMTAEEVFRLMNLAGERFLGLKVAFGGSVPRDSRIGDLHGEGASLLSLAPSAPALTAAGVLHSRLASEQARAAGAPPRVIPLSPSP